MSLIYISFPAEEKKGVTLWGGGFQLNVTMTLFWFGDAPYKGAA